MSQSCRPRSEPLARDLPKCETARRPRGPNGASLAQVAETGIDASSQDDHERLVVRVDFAAGGDCQRKIIDRQRRFGLAERV